MMIVNSLRALLGYEPHRGVAAAAAFPKPENNRKLAMRFSISNG